jgi:SAM-dependent methyltransferase
VKKPEKYTVLDQVRDFYDEHPYPPPVTGLNSYRQSWLDESRRRADYHLFWPARPFSEDISILIAGCGTSQAAKYALRHPAASVVGIDFSSTSIRHSQALKKRYSLRNLELQQLPVERARELDESFDKVVCTGVLHHLPEPEVGLRALREVLNPEGALHLMVYAPYGRTGIYMLQEYCRRLEIQPSDTAIKNLADTLMSLPKDHPLAHLLGQAPDFRTKAGLADALLNPHDRAYSVPQLFDLILQGGFTFGRWLYQAPYLPHCGDISKTPHYSHLIQLSPADQFAEVELFRGTMVRHSAVLYPTDGAIDRRKVSFVGSGWQDYIPIRLPGTITIKEKLPPGAAAVLINQNHTYPDLIFPVHKLQLRLYEGIDGERTLSEITRSVPSMGDFQQQAELARSFFEQLWWYDQVVFDASR